MATSDELIKELEQEARTTRRVLERVPEGRLEWRPHEKSMTMGQLAMHVASIPGRIAEISTRETFEVGQVIPRPSASSVAELLDTLDRSVGRATALLREMGDSGLSLPWKMVRGTEEVASMARGSMLRNIMLNHWYHHRGQLSAYLRLTGALVPAIYGASADEAPFGR
jgi:uncharacterized damage-inducible protein DinB